MLPMIVSGSRRKTSRRVRITRPRWRFALRKRRGSASFPSLCERRIGTKGSIRKLGEDDVKKRLVGKIGECRRDRRFRSLSFSLTMSGLFHHWRHPRRCYLICGIARSGSNLLSDGLRDTGRAGRPNQFFLRSSESQFRAAHYFNEDMPFADYVRGIVEKSATSNEVFGFKLMAWYLNDFLKRLRETGEFGGPGESDLEMLCAAFPRLRFLQITRRDKLRQAISKARALQTGLWKVQDGKSQVAEPNYDRALIARCLAEAEAEEAIWRAFFDRIDRQPFRVEYEELCQNHAAVIHAVLDFLEIRLPRRIRIGQPATIRQSDALSDEWERQYRASEARR